MSPGDTEDPLFSGEDTASTPPSPAADQFDGFDPTAAGPFPAVLSPSRRETWLTAAGAVPAFLSLVSIIISPALALVPLFAVVALSTTAAALSATSTVSNRQIVAYLIGALLGSLSGLLAIGLVAVVSAFIGVVV